MGSSTQSNSRPTIPDGYRVRKVTNGNGVESFYPEKKITKGRFGKSCDEWEPVRTRVICHDFRVPIDYSSLYDAIRECRSNVVTTEYIYE